MKDYKSVLSKCKRGDKVRTAMKDYFGQESDGRRYKPHIDQSPGNGDSNSRLAESANAGDQAGSNPALPIIILGILVLGLLGVGLLLAGEVFGDAPQPRVTNVYPQQVIKETVISPETKVIRETIKSDKFADCIKIKGVDSKGYVLECQET